MRTPLLRLTLVTLLATVACGDGPTGPDVDDFPGTYQMLTFQGIEPPVLGIFPDGSSLVIESGSVLIRANRTGEFRFTISAGGSAENVVDPFEWTLTGNNVRLEFQAGDLIGTGEWDGADLAIGIGGGVYRFRR